MKIDKFVGKLKGIEDKFGISPMALMVLDFIFKEQRKGIVNIMQVLNGFNQTSPATTHMHLKTLITKKILNSKFDQVDGRQKVLSNGFKLDALISYVEE